ncbi:MAG: LysR family transcriptional regulator [Gammaproteobacteria bacterium]|nr:LysR family transcriptional regulator [Gammaproteobacteria bacterium]
MNDLSVLHHLALFVEVARTGSFSLASRSLGVPPATLSRRIAAMERRIGVRLFDRTTRRVALTDAGRRHFERCEHLVDEARLAQEAIRATAERPSGHLRVSMPVDLGVHFIGPLLPEFARSYPGITFDLDLSSRHTDLAGDRIDVAIRLGTVTEERLIARRIGWVDQGLFASPAYLDLRGRPSQPADLVEHDCIFVARARRDARWRLVRGTDAMEVTVSGRFMVNNHGLMRLLAERGSGIAALAPALAREPVSAGRLTPVLPEWTVPRLPVHAVMGSRLQPACARVFVEFLATRLPLL